MDLILWLLLPVRFSSFASAAMVLRKLFDASADAEYFSGFRQGSNHLMAAGPNSKCGIGHPDRLAQRIAAGSHAYSGPDASRCFCVARCRSGAIVQPGRTSWYVNRYGMVRAATPPITPPSRRHTPARSQTATSALAPRGNSKVLAQHRAEAFRVQHCENRGAISFKAPSGRSSELASSVITMNGTGLSVCVRVCGPFVTGSIIVSALP